MSVRTYNPSVRVGNWSEDIQLEEDTLKNFLEKREKGELLIQKTSNLIKLLSTPVVLSVIQDFSVHFGESVMIMNGGSKDQTQYFIRIKPLQKCVLALNVTDPNMLLSKTVKGPVGVSACPNVFNNQRTVFRIESVDNRDANGTKLHYGQPFYLVTVGENTGRLYLSSDRVYFSKCARKSRHQEVLLVNEPSFLAQWMVQHRNPLLRLEYEHEPVEANEEVIIVHVKTNQCLAAENKHILRTPFGRECEVSGHTYLDSHNAEIEQNHWMIVASVPGSTVNPVPDPGPQN